jgi:hypothetical protein
MGSTNGTFINSIMIDPDKTFILNTFDTVSLSDLYEIDFNYSALPIEKASSPLIEIKAIDKTPTTTKLKTKTPQIASELPKATSALTTPPKKSASKRLSKKVESKPNTQKNAVSAMLGIGLIIGVVFFINKNQNSDSLNSPLQSYVDNSEEDDLELKTKKTQVSSDIALKVSIEKCQNEIVNSLCAQISNLDQTQGFYVKDNKIFGLLNYRAINGQNKKIFDTEETIKNWVAKLFTMEMIKQWQSEKIELFEIEFYIGNDLKYFSIIKATIDLASFFLEEKIWLDGALNANSHDSKAKISFTNFQDFVKQQQLLEEQRKKEEIALKEAEENKNLSENKKTIITRDADGNETIITPDEEPIEEVKPIEKAPINNIHLPELHLKLANKTTVVM